MAVEELKRVYGTPPIKTQETQMNRRQRRQRRQKKAIEVKTSDKKVDLRV